MNGRALRAGWLRRIGLGLGLALLFLPPGQASAQWQIATQDGKSTAKFGVLLQGRGEWMNNVSTAPAEGMYTSQNLYLRRMRLLMGGRVDERLSFFVETDSPNFGKLGSAGTKDYADLYIQDAQATWKVTDRLGLDAGLLLTPTTYNHLQSAASLLAIDYGPYSFVSSTPLQERVGRDVGIQARGILAGEHLEYRAGSFQGYRDAQATKPLRFAARLAWSPYKIEKSYFYPGTSLGAARRLMVGAAVDEQDGYRSVHGDVYLDRPLAARTALTLQADVSHYDGKTFLTSLPKQTDWMVEGGVTSLTFHLTPYVQVAQQRVEGSAPDETSVQAGLCWWVSGHSANMKTAWTRIKKDGVDRRNQFLLQCQVFAY